MAKRAAAYVRISDDRDGLRAGVKRQRDETAGAITDGGWQHVGTFEDNDRSAYSGKPRPGFTALAEAIEAGTVDVVVTFAADRLTRSPRELEDLIDLLESNRVHVLALHDSHLDLSTSGGRATARILGAIARQESERKSERIKAAQRQAAKEGRHHGGRRRFGYESDGLTLVPREAEAIRNAAHAVLGGEPLEGIARGWSAEGLATPKGRDWTGTLVRDVLNNARNAGLRIYQGKVIGKGVQPAIIEESTWRALMAMFGDRKRSGAPAQSLLGGFAVCGKCGEAMHQQRRSADKVRLYTCNGRTGCRGVSAVAEHVDAEVAQRFCEAVAANAEKIAAASGGNGGREREIAEQLAALDEQERALGARLATGEITDLVLQGALASIGRQQAELETELRSVATSGPSIAPSDLEGIGGLWDELTQKERRNALEIVLDSVAILPASRHTGGKWDPDRVELRWRG